MERVKEVVIISGKGGTGKTSVVACFAALAEKKVLADCDVDAADLHLILKPHVLHEEEFIGGSKAVIRKDDCTACGECLRVCRFDAVQQIEVEKGEFTYTIDDISCEGCGVCVDLCPVGAIDFPERVSGSWYISETRHGPMVHAKLGIAEENSGKMVTVVRKAAQHIAEEKDLPLVIIDGPPGIGCPVMAAASGTYLIVAVSEPTLSGMHDLERVIKLAEHFQIPIAVVVNKSDLNKENTDKIKSFCSKENVFILGELPYDPDVTRAQIKGLSVVEYIDTSISQSIREIWNRIVEILSSKERVYHDND